MSTMDVDHLMTLIDKERRRRKVKKKDLYRKTGICVYHWGVRYTKNGPSIGNVMAVLDRMGLELVLWDKQTKAEIVADGP